MTIDEYIEYDSNHKSALEKTCFYCKGIVNAYTSSVCISDTCALLGRKTTEIWFHRDCFWTIAGDKYSVDRSVQLAEIETKPMYVKI